MPHEPYQILRVEPVGDVTVVRFSESRLVDTEVIQRMREELLSLVDEGDRHRILLNFDSVRYVSSSVIGTLMSLRQKVQSGKGELKLSNFHPDFLKVFKILRLEEVFTIFDDESLALADFQKK